MVCLTLLLLIVVSLDVVAHSELLVGLEILGQSVRVGPAAGEPALQVVEAVGTAGFLDDGWDDLAQVLVPAFELLPEYLVQRPVLFADDQLLDALPLYRLQLLRQARQLLVLGVLGHGLVLAHLADAAYGRQAVRLHVAGRCLCLAGLFQSALRQQVQAPLGD